MTQHVVWGQSEEEWPARVLSQGGVKKLLRPRNIVTHLKSYDRIGIVIDADNEFRPRWESVRNSCRPYFPEIPSELPPDGLTISNGEQKRLGVWIMPDNQSRGMLETFLQFLVPEPQEAIWTHAQEATVGAVSRGAPCRAAHRDKSHIHAWLAWQDPPGKNMGAALMKNMLNARAPYANPFVCWFCRLFDVRPRDENTAGECEQARRLVIDVQYET
jgi:hypothetical protein